MILSSQIHDLFQRCNIPFIEKNAEKWLMYFEFLVKWNSTIRLTGIENFPTFLHRHIEDSLQAYLFLNTLPTNSSILDIGSGAGFPAIPLAMLFPEFSFTLTESHQRRSTFLKQLCQHLQLQNVNVTSSWIEGNPEKENVSNHHNVATFRAVNPDKILPIVSQYIQPNGFVLYWASSHSNYPIPATLFLKQKHIYSLEKNILFEIHQLIQNNPKESSK